MVGQILTDAVKEGGNSLFENNRCDWVQGEMALEFGEWLVGDTGLTREQLSPINQNVSGLAPIYLQGGGKEILIDMIRDFATAARNQGPEVLLDVWEHMTHDFQGYGVDLAESREVLGRMSEVAEHYVAGRAATMAHTTKPEWRHDWEAV